MTETNPNRIISALDKARYSSLTKRALKRVEYLGGLKKNNLHLSWMLENKEIAKIALVILFMTEGSKRRRGSLSFGNSDPGITSLFLHLMRLCYKIDEDKFRCTVQCRADQSIHELELFWSGVTKIRRFYKAQVDKRSIGKPTMKPGYKGVCRIDYFSADIFNELVEASKVLVEGR